MFLLTLLKTFQFKSKRKLKRLIVLVTVCSFQWNRLYLLLDFSNIEGRRGSGFSFLVIVIYYLFIDLASLSLLVSFTPGRPGRLLNVLCTFNLRPVSKGLMEQEFLLSAAAVTPKMFYLTGSSTNIFFMFLPCCQWLLFDSYPSKAPYMIPKSLCS